MNLKMPIRSSCHGCFKQLAHLPLGYLSLIGSVVSISQLTAGLLKVEALYDQVAFGTRQHAAGTFAAILRAYARVETFELSSNQYTSSFDRGFSESQEDQEMPGTRTSMRRICYRCQRSLTSKVQLQDECSDMFEKVGIELQVGPCFCFRTSQVLALKAKLTRSGTSLLVLVLEPQELRAAITWQPTDSTSKC